MFPYKNANELIYRAYQEHLVNTKSHLRIVEWENEEILGPVLGEMPITKSDSLRKSKTKRTVNTYWQQMKYSIQ